MSEQNRINHIPLGMHPEALKLRAIFTEAMAFEKLSHAAFEDLFREINSTYIENDQMHHFIQNKDLIIEYNQYLSIDTSD